MGLRSFLAGLLAAEDALEEDATAAIAAKQPPFPLLD